MADDPRGEFLRHLKLFGDAHQPAPKGKNPLMLSSRPSSDTKA
jgi:hypothetical protein